MKKTDTPAAETVTLRMPHNHAGRACKPGETIEVSPAQKAWLQQRGIVADTESQPEIK